MLAWRRLYLLAAAIALFSSATASAHLGSRKYLRIEVGDRLVTIEVEIEAIDASMELGLGEEVDREALSARTAAIQLWLREGIQLVAGDEPCHGDMGELEWVDRDGVAFLRGDLSFRCGEGRPLQLRDDTVFPDDAQHEALVWIAFESGEDAEVLRRGRQTLELGGPAGAGKIAGVFLWEGVLHFAFGYDHVLFLLSLLLAAGFVSKKDGWRKALKDVAILVTAFTLGHSVTLIAAALQVVVLPIQPVEVTIAASIVVVALLNVWRPEQRGPLPYLAVGFGLIHGFGFSSVLAELGLPGSHAVLALVCFNVGIEVAQLTFAAAVLPMLVWAAKQKGYRVFVRGASVLIALLAVFWVVERVVG